MNEMASGLEPRARFARAAALAGYGRLVAAVAGVVLIVAAVLGSVPWTFVRQVDTQRHDQGFLAGRESTTQMLYILLTPVLVGAVGAALLLACSSSAYRRTTGWKLFAVGVLGPLGCGAGGFMAAVLCR